MQSPLDPTRDLSGPTAQGSHTNSVRSLRDFAAMAGISIATLRRLIRSGDGPKITRLSTRRLGVQARHGQEWLDARAS